MINLLKYPKYVQIYPKGKNMAISYNGLWKTLIDHNMQKKDLLKDLSISSATVAKMGKGESVSLEVLERICRYFKCDIGDIVSFDTKEERLDGEDGKT